MFKTKNLHAVSEKQALKQTFFVVSVNKTDPVWASL